MVRGYAAPWGRAPRTLQYVLPGTSCTTARSGRASGSTREKRTRLALTCSPRAIASSASRASANAPSRTRHRARLKRASAASGASPATLRLCSQAAQGAAPVADEARAISLRRHGPPVTDEADRRASQVCLAFETSSPQPRDPIKSGVDLRRIVIAARSSRTASRPAIGP